MTWTTGTDSIFRRGRAALIVVVVASLLLVACGGSDHQDPRRVGVLDFLGLDPLLDGFKAELTAGGFIEGENVIYVVEHVERDLAEIGPAVERLLAEDVELIFAISTPATIQAKQAALPLGIPIVFAPVTDPVSSGIVESLTHPGAPITGIRTGAPTRSCSNGSTSYVAAPRRHCSSRTTRMIRAPFRG